MIRNFFLSALLLLTVQSAFAQDNSLYELQRSKVNALLDQRSANFGQYDESLTQRTGIFGFQTKRDIKNSNEILRQIALNDNEIFKELKVLMDFKDLQVEEVKTNMNSSAENMLNYRKNIKKLQDRTISLTEEVEHQQNLLNWSYIFIALLVLGIAGLVYQLNRKNKALKRLGYHEKITI